MLWCVIISDMASLKQKKKQRAVLDSLFWFVVGGGLVFGVLLLLLILVQNSDLSGQLAASVPSGSPSGSPTTSSAPSGACYTSEGCTVATSSECYKWGGVKCARYFIKDRGCLKEGTYQFKPAYAKKIGATKSFYEAMKKGCLLGVQKLIQCPSGQIKAYPGPAMHTCLDPREWPFPDWPPMVSPIPIEVACSVVGVCVPDPSPSLSPAPSQ